MSDQPAPPPSAAEPLVSVVVATHNRREKLLRLLASIRGSTGIDLDRVEVIVAADRCSDGTQRAVLVGHPAAHVIDVPDYGHLLFMAGARAAGAAVARGEFVFIVDDDNILASDCLTMLVATARSDERIGVVGPLMLLWPPGSGVYCAGAWVSRHGQCRHAHEQPRSEALVECEYLPNAFLVRREVMQRIAPLDPLSFPHNWSEQDQCFRVLDSGYSVCVDPRARVWHDSGYTAFTTRISEAAVRDQSRARIFIRRRYPDRFASLAGFWVLTFPITTAYYLIRFLRARHPLRLMRAYVAGTVEALRAPLPLAPVDQLEAADAVAASH
ncbi:MAG: glycosyltransferase family 2 protein [Candidatus Dormibacteraeota bacterium]|nr:glycosyltransferase family 2 protein [Candidatus Dormibacteraeota bacterium]